MATTASSRTSPSSRRTPGASTSPPPLPSITRGATARSAASPRVASSLNSTTARRPPKSSSPVPPVNGESREALSASLKQETDQKEQLLVRLQDKDQTITALTADNVNLTSALSSAEARVNELYAEQSRSELELAQRIDISEKLRAQVRELEKEKREIQRRYNEQMTTFEAERQAFYDNEQHLKSRIQSLSQARKRSETVQHPQDSGDVTETDDEEESIHEPSVTVNVQQNVNDPESEPAEMTALKLELSTLSTSYSSLQSTLVLLQTQLVDLKRVNHELQEENESYMILLREKTLSGQYDLMKQVGGGSSSGDDDDEEDRDEPFEGTDVGSLRSLGRSNLDPVDEESGDPFEQSFHNESDPDVDSIRSPRHTSRQGRKRTISNSAPRGESLADLPITGPGLDLAAELGRAENKDILAGNVIEDRDRSLLSNKNKRTKRGSETRKVSSDTTAEPASASNDIDALRTEVKSLKDANKALSLYASKIIDRIIMQEGFEHVLAVDYEPTTPSVPEHKPEKSSPLISRPQIQLITRASSNPSPNVETRVTSPTQTREQVTKANRRSLSFDWKSLSIFSEKKPEPNLRPLTLKPGASTTGARKLDTQEDEEDRKERERINATMKLMGIQPAPQQRIPVSSTPSMDSQSGDTPTNNGQNWKFSFWSNKNTTENSEVSSVHSTPSLRHGGGGSPSGLTQEALEHAEAESTIANLEAHERSLSAELARGGRSGFTEIAPRRSIGRRSQRSGGGSGSGSTVWSAGMSGRSEDD